MNFRGNSVTLLRILPDANVRRFHPHVRRHDVQGLRFWRALEVVHLPKFLVQRFQAASRGRFEQATTWVASVLRATFRDEWRKRQMDAFLNAGGACSTFRFYSFEHLRRCLLEHCVFASVVQIVSENSGRAGVIFQTKQRFRFWTLLIQQIRHSLRKLRWKHFARGS